jgi:preprotein translocase subunit SecG
MNKFLGVPTWVADSFPYIQAGLVILIAITCVVMIVAILASPPQTGRGSNAITGASESYYTKNRSSNNQGRIRNLVIICAITIAVCAILYFVSYSIYQGPIGG